MNAVYWNDGRSVPQMDYGGEREKKAGVHWCDYYVQWSPKGSYFATLVPNARSSMSVLGRFFVLGRDCFNLFISKREPINKTSRQKLNIMPTIKLFAR